MQRHARLYGTADPRPPEDCAIGRGAPDAAGLIRRGDSAIGGAVDQIMGAPVWPAPENAAIVVTWDEDSYSSTGQQGCCGFDPGSLANFGGGHIATIVVTNHGPRHTGDAGLYNHYSLLRTAEEAFGIGEYIGLAGAADKGVRAITPLFAVNGKISAAAQPAR